MTTDKNYYGFVLYCGEINGRDDSDFYAIVWDEETQSVLRIDDGTTRCAAPARYHRADAPAEIVAKARAYQIAGPLAASARLALLQQRLAIEFGDTVNVVKGRKVAKGQYEVTGVYANEYHRVSRYGNSLGIRGFDPKAFRVGLRNAAGERFYTSMDNCEKVGVVEPTAAEISAEAERQFHGFHGGGLASLSLYLDQRIIAYEEKRKGVVA